MLNLLESVTINGYSIIYVPWNVFLALIPVFIAYYLYKRFSKKKFRKITNKEKSLFLFLILVWFFFFPNTSYLFTEVRYIVNYCPEITKLRICSNQTFIPPFFLIYSLIGIPTFVYSLKTITKLLIEVFNKRFKIFPIFMIPISALGVIIGLVGRFNSWNIFIHPILVLETGISYLFVPDKLLGVIAYSLLMYIIYYSYSILVKEKK